MDRMTLANIAALGMIITVAILPTTLMVWAVKDWLDKKFKSGKS